MGFLLLQLPVHPGDNGFRKPRFHKLLGFAPSPQQMFDMLRLEGVDILPSFKYNEVGYAQALRPAGSIVRISQADNGDFAEPE